MAAVDKIEDQRKPEDFIGHRNRTPVVLLTKVGNHISNSSSSNSFSKDVLSPRPSPLSVSFLVSRQSRVTALTNSRYRRLRSSSYVE